jgi:hypothetical protein
MKKRKIHRVRCIQFLNPFSLRRSLTIERKMSDEREMSDEALQEEVSHKLNEIVLPALGAAATAAETTCHLLRLFRCLSKARLELEGSGDEILEMADVPLI